MTVFAFSWVQIQIKVTDKFSRVFTVDSKHSNRFMPDGWVLDFNKFQGKYLFVNFEHSVRHYLHWEIFFDFLIIYLEVLLHIFSVIVIPVVRVNFSVKFFTSGCFLLLFET